MVQMHVEHAILKISSILLSWTLQTPLGPRELSILFLPSSNSKHDHGKGSKVEVDSTNFVRSRDHTPPFYRPPFIFALLSTLSLSLSSAVLTSPFWKVSTS